MAYTKSIPLSTDYIDQSQPLLKNNFESIDAMVNVNHGAFNGADEGKHKFVTLVDQAAAPVIAATEASIFYGTVGGTKNLYYQIGTGTPQNFTGGTLAGGVHGWARFPNGLLMKWGQVLGTGDCTLTWTSILPAAPAFTSVFNVQACPYVINPHWGIPTNRFVQVIDSTNDPLTIRFYVSERTSMTAAQAEISVIAIGI